MPSKSSFRRLTARLLLVAAPLCLAAFSSPPGIAQQTSPRQDTAASTMPPLARQGKLIFDQTPQYAQQYTGNQLSCNSCHRQSGTAAYAAPMIDIAGLFPMFSKRAGHVISLQNRIQECFTRSEAGIPPPLESPQLKALVAYIDWLSRDQVKGKPYPGRGLVQIPTLTGDPVRGKDLYASRCAACHGANGAGMPPVFPPLWGKDSYNDGAGIHRPEKMAAFVIRNMPLNQPGTLTPQQAWDVAVYLHSMPHPQFNPAYSQY